MKGDFTRFTFDPRKHYERTLMQQGRVQLDADWNEQQEIHSHQRQVGTADVVGQRGAPKVGGGFQIGLAAGEQDLTIAPGRIYVGGLLCVNEASVPLTDQPDLKVASGPLVGFAMPNATGRYLAFLDVWSRHVDALLDPDLREKALDGPDTTTRVKTVWQVKLVAVAADATCSQFDPTWRPAAETTGRMSADTTAPTDPQNPCLLPPTAGYKSLDNQLYRVEIHRGGDRDGATPATIKWSRLNGAAATTVTRSGQVLAAQDLGRDELLQFADNQWVEIADDRMDLTHQRGELLQIESVDAATQAITVGAATAVPEVDTSRPVILRRWDQSGTTATGDGVAMTAGALALEAGIEVSFAPGTYAPGEYWTIPARAAISEETGQIEWPRDAGGQSQPLRPAGIEHHYCPLALVDFDATSGRFLLVPGGDCRPRFPSLTGIAAEDVAFDDSVCQLDGARTVQQALNALCQRDGEACTVVAGPADDLAALIAAIPSGGHAKICFRAGTYNLASPLRISGKGHIRVQGCGPGTRIVASSSEAAVILENCLSAAVADCAIEAGTAGAGAGQSRLNGALTILDCPTVEVTSCHLRCAGGAERAASALTVRNASAAATSVAWIERCVMEAGHQQIGILLVNVARAHVQGNVVRAGARPATTQLVQSRAYRAALREHLISAIRPGFDPTPGTNARITFNDHSVHFRTEPSLAFRRRVVIPPQTVLLAANDWEAALQRLRPPGIFSPQALRDALVRFADRLIATLGEADGSSTRFRSVLDSVFAQDEASAGQGIVIGGVVADEIRILDNTIDGAIQGIHVGVSRRDDAAPEGPFLSEWVQIAGNRLGINLPTSATRERHGIFVGNCRSLFLDDNRIAVRRVPVTSTLTIEGIRLLGLVDRRIVVRHNHVDQATTGILFIPLILFTRPQWIITDNLCVAARQAVGVAAGAQNLVRGLADNFA